MKQILVILILSVLYFITESQSFTLSNSQKTASAQPLVYQPLLKSINLWSVLTRSEYVHVAPTDPYSWMKSNWYKLGKEAIIDSKTYYSLMTSISENHYSWALSEFIREENGKVYLMNNELEENLLYDFNLKVGESMNFKYKGKFDLVSRLDSVKDTLINSVTRKLYNLSTYPSFDPNWKQSEKWIEGIGSSWGLKRENSIGMTPGGVFCFLTCISENEKLLYQSKKYPKCFYNERYLGLENLSIENSIQVFPNPGSGKFTVRQTGNQTDFRVEVLDITGLIIKEFNNSFNTQMNIDLSSQKKGIYFLRLKNENGIVTKKIILK